MDLVEEWGNGRGCKLYENKNMGMNEAISSNLQQGSIKRAWY